MILVNKQRIAKAIVSTLVFFCTNFAFAQSGANDPTFNPSDIGFGSGVGANGMVQTTTLQPDGKILITGGFTSYNNTTRFRIARININGLLDTTFSPPGIGPNNIIYASTIQSDGKILIGGDFSAYNDIQINRIARLNANGTLDLTFNPGNGLMSRVNAIAIQTDGKILIGGAFASFNSISRIRIARINTNGALDTTFNPGTGASGDVEAIFVQPDGKILITGNFTSYNGRSINRIARLHTNGTLDTTFNPGTGANSTIGAISVQSNGKILIGGDFTSFNGKAINRMARLNANGTLDSIFNPETGANSSIEAISIQLDEKILIGGNFTSFNGTIRNRIARLNVNGELDTTFNPQSGSSNSIQTISLQSNGKILIGGNFTSYNGTIKNRIALLHPNGILDSTFSPLTGSDNEVNKIAVQPDGKLMLLGEFTSYNGITRNRIARIHSNGLLDTTFNSGTFISLNSSSVKIEGILVQPDGKIMVGGNFNSYNGISINRIARLQPNGSLDGSFNPGYGPNADITSIARQTDGKILISGHFTSYNGIIRNRLTRINTDGSLDTSFLNGTGPSWAIDVIAVQPDGKILIAGNFINYNGIAINRIARIHPNGSLDTTFNPGTGVTGIIEAISVLSNGKILIVGDISFYNGKRIYRIARLNTNGFLDTTFNIGTGANFTIFSAVTQPDGKILIGGGFTTFNGTAANRIARLHANGTLDITFNYGIGANDAVYDLVMQPSEKIIIGGKFTAYNGTGRNRVARIVSLNCINSTHSASITACKRYTSPSGNYTWTTSGTYRDTIPNVNGCDSIITINLNIDTLNLGVSKTASTLTANATGVIYQWIDCNNGNIAITGATGQSFTPSVSGNYAVIVSKNSCIDTSACFTVNTVGIDEIKQQTLIIYPNPTKNKLAISGYSINANYKLIDYLGKVLFEGTTLENETEVDLSLQPSGIYLLMVNDRAYKIIKH